MASRSLLKSDGKNRFAMRLTRFFEKGRNYTITITRMTPLQIAWRARRLLLQHLWQRQKWSRRFPPKSLSAIIGGLGPNTPRFGCTPPIAGDHPAIKSAEAISQGVFTFLNMPVYFENCLPDWQASPDGDRLWTYNLHYFEYGRDLLWAFRATRHCDYLHCLVRLINDWIEKNPFWTRTAWDAYPLSKRLIAWSTLLGHLHREPTFRDDCLEALMASMCLQADFLASNLEYDVDNNHLLTNARALVWAGIYLRGHSKSEPWIKKGLYILAQEVNRQLLSDGGHAERSLSYHLVVLQDILETTILLEQSNIIVPYALRQAMEAMFTFLSNFIKFDGSLATFNDTVTDYPLEACGMMAVGALYLARPELRQNSLGMPGDYPDWILGEKGRKAHQRSVATRAASKSTAFSETGYFVMRSENKQGAFALIFDCGPIGPRHSAAHAHADTLSFELTACGQSLLIDPGVYEYKAGAWRDYFRSTAVHNTITVDRQNQSVFWGPFRVAEMAQAQLLCWETNEDHDYVEGKHDGYTRFKSPVVHRRSIRYVKPNRWIINDILESDGRANHLYELNFHLGLSAQPNGVTVHSSPISFSNGIELCVKTEHPPGTSVAVHDGWASASWKRKQQTSILRYSLETSAIVTTFKTTLTVYKTSVPFSF
jgi:uncharacterized heparinase superfamily protein